MIETYAQTDHAVTVVLDAPAQCVAQVYADLPGAGSVLVGTLFVSSPPSGTRSRRVVAIASIPGARGYRVEAQGIDDAWSVVDTSRDPRDAWIVEACDPCACGVGLVPSPGVATEPPAPGMMT